MEPDTRIIDLTFLKKLTDGNPDKMRYFIGIHLKTAPGLFDQLENMFEEMSYEEIFSRAHSLKPQCDYVGIIGLKEKLIEIEHAAKSKQNKNAIFALVQNAIELNNRGMKELTFFLD